MFDCRAGNLTDGAKMMDNGNSTNDGSAIVAENITDNHLNIPHQIIKTESVDTYGDVSSSIDSRPCNVQIKTEIKTEAGPSNSNDESRRLQTRECCRYGISCYRYY